MFSICCRKFLHMKWSASSSTCLLHIRNSYLRFSSVATEQPSLTVDYLVNKCGFTQESAFKTSKRINIKSTRRSDSVLALLDSYGLPKSCILKIINTVPKILCASPKKTLEPKMVYFSKMGISGPDLARILSMDPSLLAHASLRNNIIPSIEFLMSFLLDSKKVIAVLIRLRWLRGIKQKMVPNIEILRNHGLSESRISKLFVMSPGILSLKQSQLNGIVLQAIEMGSVPSSSMFIYAVRLLSQLSKTMLEAKWKVFKDFGLSDSDIHFLFRRLPYCLARSEIILRMQLDLFMNKLNLTAVEVSRNPFILTYSLQKRSIPRCSVIQVLLAQDLMKRKSIITALTITEASFLEKFVRKYQQELPQLLKEYKRSME